METIDKLHQMVAHRFEIFVVLLLKKKCAKIKVKKEKYCEKTRIKLFPVHIIYIKYCKMYSGALSYSHNAQTQTLFSYIG